MTIVSIDGAPIGFQAVRDERIDLDLATPVPEMARRAVQMAIDAANGKKPAKQTDYLPGIPFDSSNVEAKADQIWGCA